MQGSSRASAAHGQRALDALLAGGPGRAVEPAALADDLFGRGALALVLVGMLAVTGDAAPGARHGRHHTAVPFAAQWLLLAHRSNSGSAHCHGYTGQWLGQSSLKGTLSAFIQALLTGERQLHTGRAALEAGALHGCGAHHGVTPSTANSCSASSTTAAVIWRRYRMAAVHR